MQYTSRTIDVKRLPLGATAFEDGVYFAVWAPECTKVAVHLFDREEHEIKKFFLKERKGGVWYGFEEGVTPGTCYAFEAMGKEEPEKGIYFQDGRLLADPYAFELNKPFLFNSDAYSNHSASFIPKAVIAPYQDDFDWQGVTKPVILRNRVILFETHVKGFTKLNEELPEQLRGTYLGMAEPCVIEHLKKLGITAVQLMPVAASMSEPDLTERGLCNYWGYNPVCFMAPDPRYACDPFNAVNEFRTMVRELHRAGIAVILDVVYNHTAEGGYGGPVLSMKGLANKDYYAFADGENGPNYKDYYNVSGCGNSYNTDSRPGLKLVIESLKHWLTYMQVDGFRFDLGVTLNREFHGSSRFEFEPNSGFLKSCFCDDVISQAILIAEPWDIGHDGYRLGGFPVGWSEQNDHFRDGVRRFWRGDRGLLGEFATRIMGSRDIFRKDFRSINASVNYVTYHDGFTLEDLVSYNGKHNEANGYNNTDGTNENYSTNCGEEGPSKNPVVLARRWQLKRNYIATMLIAQGMPHLLAGDEFSHTQMGNNNAYCQDNEISYIKWDKSAETRDFIDFIGRCAELRKSSLMLSEINLDDDRYHLRNNVYQAHWYRPNGVALDEGGWNSLDPQAMLLHAGALDDETGEHWCLLFNNTDNDIYFTLPKAPAGRMWSAVIDTSEPTGVPSRFSNRTGLASVCSQHSIKVMTLAEAPEGTWQAPESETAKELAAAPVQEPVPESAAESVKEPAPETVKAPEPEKKTAPATGAAAPVETAAVKPFAPLMFGFTHRKLNEEYGIPAQDKSAVTSGSAPAQEAGPAAPEGGDEIPLAGTFKKEDKAEGKAGDAAKEAEEASSDVTDPDEPASPGLTD